jgi:hypothetical protein
VPLVIELHEMTGQLVRHVSATPPAEDPAALLRQAAALREQVRDVVSVAVLKARDPRCGRAVGCDEIARILEVIRTWRS